MEENIEVKDVQKTEYLDKNGLDMLWTKVKENTHNQVEVERNRAVAKENSIIDTKADKSALDNYALNTTLTALEQKVTANTTAISAKQDAGNYVPYELYDNDFYKILSGIAMQGSDEFENNKMVIYSQRIQFDSNSKGDVNDEYGNSTTVAAGYVSLKHKGIGETLINTECFRGMDSIGGTIFELNRNGVELSGGDNNHVLTSNASTIDITEYAKKTDIPEVDTSDFISKTTTDVQIINSPLYIGNVVIADNMEDENTDYVALEPTKLQFSENNYTSSIELNGKDTDANAECSIEINAGHGNPLISLYSGNTDNGNDDSALEITNSGISISNSQNENIGPDKVFATNGSVADLAQYVKKSEITADGNVDDVQVNGVSVVENKIANIKPATKEELGVVKVGDGLNVTDGVISVSAGNYLTYDSVVNEQYYISSPKSFIFNGRNVQDSASSISNDRIIVGSNSANIYSKIVDSYIQLRGDKNALNITYANITGNEYKGDDPTPYQQFVLNKQGVWLYGGDDNHVLTSNASTIDITQYALKSVYDEKIAALEARIAALEAKHVEV